MASNNSYIVVFKSQSDAPSASEDLIESLAQKVESTGGSIKHRYTSRVMRGFAGSFSEETRAELEKNEAVKYIEPDGPVTTQ